MAKYTQELKGANERINTLLFPLGYSIKVNHRNGYTALDITNLTNNSTDYLTGGLSDKEALAYIYLMCKTIGIVNNPAINTIN